MANIAYQYRLYPDLEQAALFLSEPSDAVGRSGT